MIKKREDMEPTYQLDLSVMYTSDEVWEEAYKKILERLDIFHKLKVALSDKNGEVLFSTLSLISELYNEVYKLYVYAYLKYYQDTRNSVYISLKLKADDINSKSIKVFSFVEPEILSLGEDKVNQFINSNDGLKLYKHDLHNIFRKAKHTLSKELEEVLAGISSFTNLPIDIYNAIVYAESEFEQATDKDGNKKEITHAERVKLAESRDRTLRETSYKSYSKYFFTKRESISGLYAGLIRKNNFIAKTRGYKDSVEAALY